MKYLFDIARLLWYHTAFLFESFTHTPKALNAGRMTISNPSAFGTDALFPKSQRRGEAFSKDTQIF